MPSLSLRLRRPDSDSGRLALQCESADALRNKDRGSRSMLPLNGKSTGPNMLFRGHFLIRRQLSGWRHEA